MPINRIAVRWSGFPGAPGYSNFYVPGSLVTPEDLGARAISVRNFFFSIRGLLPASVGISVEPEVAVIDESTGQQTDAVVIDTPPNTTGTGTGAYAGPVGAVINWNTSTFRQGRRLRGRTFMVPLVGAFDSDGTLSESALGTLRDAANDLLGVAGGTGLVAWGRPSPANGAGVSAPVVSATVPDLAAVLRSRRD